MRVLVTGGAGFIGSHIVEHQLKKGNEVIVLDNLRTGYRKNLDGFDVEFVEGTIEDKRLINDICSKGIKYIFHLAALVSVPESMEKIPETININTIGTINVLDAAKANNVEKVVLSSSAANYGDNPIIPKKEIMYPEPQSPYAITKLDGEYYLSMYSKYYGVPTVSLRYFNVYGPRQDPKSQYAAAIPIFIYNAINNKDIIIFGDGDQTRDFIYVTDIAKANIFMAENKYNGVYNIANGESITITELAKMIIDITGSSSKIVYDNPRPGDVKHSKASIRKLLDTGFKPTADFEQGLKETIDYFSNTGN